MWLRQGYRGELVRRIVGFEDFHVSINDYSGMAIVRPIDKKTVEASTNYPPEVTIFSAEQLAGLWIKHDASGKMYALSSKDDVQYPMFNSPYFGYFGFAGDVVSAYIERVDPSNAGSNLPPEECEIFLLLGWAKVKGSGGVEATIDIVGFDMYSIDDKITFSSQHYTVTESWHDGHKNVVRMSL